MLCVFQTTLHLNFLRQDVSFTNCPGTWLSPPPTLLYTHPARFYVGSGALNTHPHACVSDTLLSLGISLASENFSMCVCLFLLCFFGIGLYWVDVGGLELVI